MLCFAWSCFLYNMRTNDTSNVIIDCLSVLPGVIIGEDNISREKISYLHFELFFYYYSFVTSYSTTCKKYKHLHQVTHSLFLLLNHRKQVFLTQTYPPANLHLHILSSQNIYPPKLSKYFFPLTAENISSLTKLISGFLSYSPQSIDTRKINISSRQTRMWETLPK